ncbi:hypothetical protein [Gracilimonas sp.]|uniref:hypothetical protein n=1 Tax=Gracilimonas sp. TaxID=1974203 RepID=UPI0032F01823
MIILHRKRDDTESDRLEEKLNKLVISFKTINHERKAENRPYPYIEEDGRQFQSDEEIEMWLRELESQLKWQRSLSGDGCYINPKNGKVC